MEAESTGPESEPARILLFSSYKHNFGPRVLLELADWSDGAGGLRESILIWTFFHAFLLLPSYLSQELLDFGLQDGTVGGKPGRIAEG